MSTIESILTALSLFYEIFKELHKSDSEKFEKEWGEDVPKFLKALQDRKSSDPEIKAKANRDLAMLISRYNIVLL